MSEAFCLYEDRERFQPYQKHHSTVLDAARLAERLGVKNLILYHTEDRTLDTRKSKYAAIFLLYKFYAHVGLDLLFEILGSLYCVTVFFFSLMFATTTGMVASGLPRSLNG